MAHKGELGFRSDEASAGDCPNPACHDGCIAWHRWAGPTDLPALYAGKCDRCGQWAAQCPVCGDLVPLGDGVVECSCELSIGLLWEAGSPRIEITTADDVTRTYGLPEE